MPRVPSETAAAPAPEPMRKVRRFMLTLQELAGSMLSWVRAMALESGRLWPHTDLNQSWACKIDTTRRERVSRVRQRRTQVRAEVRGARQIVEPDPDDAARGMRHREEAVPG